MKIKLAERAKAELSPIRKIFQQLPTLNHERIDIGLEPIIDLTIGQPHVPINPNVIAGLRERLNSSDISVKFGYSQVNGRPETLDAIIKLYKKYYPKVVYSLHEVMCTNGANQALWNALSILVEEKNKQKDIVLTFEPFFGHYNAQVSALGGKLIKIPTYQGNFIPTAEALVNTLLQYPQAKVLILNFPNNPSGVNPDSEELVKIVTVLNSYPQVAIILDEVYRELNFSSYTSLLDIAPEFKERCVVINSGSKGLLGTPDIRIGMAAGPTEWIEAMCGQQLLATASVSYLSQIALASTINAHLKEHPDNSWQQQSLHEYQINTEYMLQHLRMIGLSVSLNLQGGFYILADASNLIGARIPDEISITNANGHIVKLNNLQERIGTNYLRSDIDIATLFLHAAGVATVPGSGFGIEPRAGLLRISCAANKQILELAVKRLKEVCTKLSVQPKISSLSQANVPAKSSVITKSIAIIGVGNIGEWISYMLLMELLAGNLVNLDKIYFVGRDTKKLEAKIVDQLHAFIISSRYEKNVTDISTQGIDQLLEKVVSTNNYAVLKDASCIVTAFGAPMTANIMERSDLLLANDRIVIDIAEKIKIYANKNAVIINLANPLDVITWRLQELTNFPVNQVIGVSGTLDISRLAQAIHEVLNIRYQDIDINSLVVLGQHGPAMVPLLSHVKILNKPLLEIANPEQINAIIHFAKHKGTQIMEHLGKVPPHIGTARATLVILRTILNNDLVRMPCSAWNESYQAFMGSVICFENNQFIVKSIDINQAEKEGLSKSAAQIKQDKALIAFLYAKADQKEKINSRQAISHHGFFPSGISPNTLLPAIADNNKSDILRSKL